MTALLFWFVITVGAHVVVDQVRRSQEVDREIEEAWQRGRQEINRAHARAVRLDQLEEKERQEARLIERWKP